MNFKTSPRSLTTLLRDLTVLVLIQAMLLSSLPRHAFGSAPIEAKRDAFAYGETYGPEVQGVSRESDSTREDLSALRSVEAPGAAVTTPAPTPQLTLVNRGIKSSRARPVARTMKPGVLPDSPFAPTHADTLSTPVSSLPNPVHLVRHCAARIILWLGRNNDHERRHAWKRE